MFMNFFWGKVYNQDQGYGWIGEVYRWEWGWDYKRKSCVVIFMYFEYIYIYYC